MAPVVDLKAPELQALKGAGFNQNQIRAYQLGKVTGATKTAMTRALLSANSGALSQPQITPRIDMQGRGGGSTPASNPTARNNVSWATGNNPIIPGNGGGLGGQYVPGPGQSAPRSGGGIDWGALGDIAAGAGKVVLPGLGRRTETVGPAGRSTGTRSTGKSGGGGSVFEGLEFPDYDYVPPQIQMRDFTNDANAQVDKAFAPLFAAYAQQKQDINTKAGQDRQVVGGLYDQYVKSIAEGAAQTDKRYDTAGDTRAQQGQSLAGNIGGYYQSANTNTADLLKSIGAQQAAPELLQQGANEQAVQQAQVGQGTQAMQDYYGQQNQGAQDQAVAYQDAARNEGVRGQANVLADAASQIGGVNRQEAGSRTEQATTALDIAQQLANRDFQMQSANVGNAMNNAQFGYQGEVGNYNAARQNIQDQFDMDYKRTQLEQGQQQIDLEATKAAGGEGINPTGVNAIQQQWTGQLGEQAVGEITSAIQDATVGSQVRPGDSERMGNAFVAALSRAPQIAAANGVSVASVQNAMIDMWKGSFGAADTIAQPKVAGQR